MFPKNLSAAVAAAIVLLGLSSFFSSGYSQILNDRNLDKACREHGSRTSRRTVVYVDQSSVKKTDLEWGQAILARLGLGPKEWLVVVSVDPSNMNLKEVFNLCYPELSKEELKLADSNRTFAERLIQKPAAEQIKDDLAIFKLRLQNALSWIVNNSAQPSSKGASSGVLETIALDLGRFDDKQAVYRVIIYSDGSALLSSGLQQSGANTSTLGSKGSLRLDFRGADVVIFGLTTEYARTISDIPIRKSLSESWAYLSQITQRLSPQVPIVYGPPKVFYGTINGSGTKNVSVDALLQLALQAEVPQVTGWLVLLRTSQTPGASLYVPFAGDYRCDATTCNLNATVRETIPPGSTSPFFRKDDRITLTGTKNKLTGHLVGDSRETYDGGQAGEVRYKLDFYIETGGNAR